MRNMVENMDENVVLEEENGPCGELVVLAAKPYQ